jgi:hypothetical protein
MTVWIYVETNKQVGDVNHLKVFADADAADRWFEKNDPEGGRIRLHDARIKNNGPSAGGALRP